MGVRPGVKTLGLIRPSTSVPLLRSLSPFVGVCVLSLLLPLGGTNIDNSSGCRMPKVT